MRFKELSKKKFAFALSIALILVVLLAMTGCVSANKIDENKPTVVCTGFAQYDWVLNILGEESSDWNVIRINDKGADMHSYQPSAEDMIIISKADLLVYTGGMSEEWIEEAMESQDFQGIAYGLLENGEPICMEDSHGHAGHEHEGHSHDEYDEHIWLSLDNAKEFCKDIEVLLSDINPSETYKINCQDYIKKLDELGKQFETVLGCSIEGDYDDDDNIEHEEEHEDDHDHDLHNAIIFADRFPFRYLAADYHLEWYAAFPGCSAETEASFDTLKELSNTVNEIKPRGIFVTETGDDSLAKTVIANSKGSANATNSADEELANIEILRVNSMQSVPKGEPRGYLEIMSDNLEALKVGLE